ncbi:MAG: M42 family metallopeptidase [Bacillota bacterium]
MSARLLDRLQQLTAIWGPSGRERKVAEALAEMITPFVDEVKMDRLGNLLAIRRGTGEGRRVLLTAHMDTPGALALNVSEKGLVYLAPVGGLRAHHAIGQRVVWGSGLVGVLQTEYLEEAREVDFKRLFCDIGATSREEALENLSLGDACAFVGELQLLEDLVVGPGLDNRAGCAVLVEVAEHLGETAHDLTFAFTCHGESAVRFGGLAAHGVEPDLALVVDGGQAGDVPKAPRLGGRLGGGPALKLKDAGYVAHHGLAALVQSVAEEQAIPLQVEISQTGSEGQLLTSAGRGVPTAVIDLPVRYRGTANEMVNLRDLHGAADLLLKLLHNPLELS